MKIHKTRVAVAAAMLVGLSVLAACGDDKDEAKSDTPAVVVTPSETAAPSTEPSGSPSPSGSPTTGDDDAEFLAVGDLPTGSRYGTWRAEAEKDGLRDPEYFCIKGELPADDTEFTTYSSDLEAEAAQFIVDAESETDAQDLVTALKESLASCVEDYKKENPSDGASGKDYGDHAGATLFGRFFAPKDSEYNLQMFAVGRSGSTVTVVVLGQGGKEDEAPLDAFKSMVSAAMGKLA
jgi:hypothetical protein